MRNEKTTSTDTNKVDKAIDQQKTSSIDETAKQAENETRTGEPGSTGGDRSTQHNNGRGGGK